MRKIERKSDAAAYILLLVLFLVLICLTYALIYMRNITNSAEEVPFDLDMLTADRENGQTDISNYLLPAFIGITSDGERYGTSGYANTVSEMYDFFAPTISETMSEERISKLTDDEWDELTNETSSVYIRYHSTLPDNIIALFADSSSSLRHEEKNDRTRVSAYVYEMFIIPYSTADKSIEIAVRDHDGSSYIYRCEYPIDPITSDDLSEMIRSYRSAMTAFTFAGEDYSSKSSTEPVFLRPVYTKNILITGYTAELIQNSTDELESVMRVFGLNPDKLLNKHVDDYGEGSYIDSQGVLYLGKTEFEYIAADEGGVPLSYIIGSNDTYSIGEYLDAAISVFSNIKTINKNYSGGDADIALTGVISEKGYITFEFSYFFDNYKVYGIPNAFTATFTADRLIYAKLYTIAARNLGGRTESLNEWWFLKYLENIGEVPYNTTLVYRSDFVSESIKAEWTAEIETSRVTGDGGVNESK